MDRGPGADRSAWGREFYPPQSLGGVKLRRANILSDILSFEDAAAEAPNWRSSTRTISTSTWHRSPGASRPRRIEADTAPRPVQTTFEWLLRQDSSGRRAVVPDTVRLNPALVAIEQFAPADSGRLRAFYDTLLYARRPVRIAVLGDSFIEGDILTADLRENCNWPTAGAARAFAPMASPLTAFRRTIKTQSKGWTAYNIMQRKAAPQNLRGHLLRLGLGVPALGGRLHAVGKHRLPAAARLLHRGTGVLHQPRRQPHRTDAQRFAPPRIRGRTEPPPSGRSRSRRPISVRWHSR